MYRQISKNVDDTNATTQTTTQTTQTTTQTSVQAKDYSFTNEDKMVLTLLHKYSKLTQKELALELGWTVDRVKYYLAKMKKRQIIKRVGSSHNGHWEVLIDENSFR